MLIDWFDVVGRYHSGAAGAENRSRHPTFVDGLAIDDDVAVAEGDFVIVVGVVVVHGPERTLQADNNRY